MSGNTEGVMVVGSLEGIKYYFPDSSVLNFENYNEYHKRETFLLRYFFRLFRPHMEGIKFPNQFQVRQLNFRGIIRGRSIYPFQVKFSSSTKQHPNSCEEYCVWILLDVTDFGELSVVARTKPLSNECSVYGWDSLTSDKIEWVIKK